MSKQQSTIGDNGKKYQNQLGIFQDFLSKRENLTFHTIVKIEAGSRLDPRIETIKKLQRLCGHIADNIMKLDYE